MYNTNSISNYLPWEETKKWFCKFIDDYERFIYLLLSIQNVYFHYARSSLRFTTRSIDRDKWRALKKAFNLEKETRRLNSSIEEIAKLYKMLSYEAEELLGIKRDNWTHFWKNVSYKKKDCLKSLNI